jgi:hypothetical protein
MAASAPPGGRIDSVLTTDLAWRASESLTNKVRQRLADYQQQQIVRQFGIIKRLQARGDFEVLASRGRRVRRVHLQDLDAGLRDLHAIVQKVA